MRKPRLAVTIGLVVALVLIIAAVSIPNLMRSRLAEKRALNSTGLAGDMSGMMAYLEASPRSQADFEANHKVIRTAKLALVVSDVRASLDRIRATTAALGGYVEKATLGNEEGRGQSGEMVLRVPQTKLDAALAVLKQGASRVENETIESRDVTREFVDTEARLRNFRAEEAQFLTILKRASTVKDTIDVSEKLSDVRGEIERMQAQLNYLSHEVEMSTITIGLRPQVPITVAALEWHPLVKARVAFREMLAGLADYADTMVAILVNLPLILVWVGTIGAALFGGWRLFKWMRPRFFAKPSATA